MSDTPRRYPEHEKLHAIKDKSQTVGDFLEWLSDKFSAAICVMHEHTDECYGIDNFRYCGLRDGEYMPLQQSRLTLLAEFFEIDQNKIDAEKDEMLADIRHSAEVTP